MDGEKAAGKTDKITKNYGKADKNREKSYGKADKKRKKSYGKADKKREKSYGKTDKFKKSLVNSAFLWHTKKKEGGVCHDNEKNRKTAE